MPLVLALAELAAGLLLLASGITTASFAQIIRGQAHQAYTAAQGDGTAPAAGAGIAPAAGLANAHGEVNPIPGATGSRLDQGFDVTGTSFLAPFAGTVVASVQKAAGWGGGGYFAIRDALDPHRVVYMAEGLLPVVGVGDTVTAGQPVAQPQINPYNGVLGNIEIGRANPAAPLQPLAQVIAHPGQMVDQFYAWLRSLGGPVASSAAHAGVA